nr:PREDICTED: protein RIC-3-like [Pelecanus crispus]
MTLLVHAVLQCFVGKSSVSQRMGRRAWPCPSAVKGMDLERRSSAITATPLGSKGVNKSERAENHPVDDNSNCFKCKQDTILVDYPELSQPSAEELAEGMEDMEDEEYLCNETLLSDLTMGRGCRDLMQKKEEITGISEEKRDLHHSQSVEECCCCYKNDDPAVITKNAGFHSERCREAEEPAQEDPSVESEKEYAALEKQKASGLDETGTKRNCNMEGLEK